MTPAVMTQRNQGKEASGMVIGQRIITIYMGKVVTPAVFGPQVYPGPFVCVLKDGLLSMTNGPPLLVCHWMGYTVICDRCPSNLSCDQGRPALLRM